MQSLPSLLAARIQPALAQVCPGAPLPAQLVFPAANPQFGDYQCNAAMSAAKAAGKNPRTLAQEIVAALKVSDLCSSVDIAGPGFINFKLKPEFLLGYVGDVLSSPRLGIDQAAVKQRIVVDFSGPNLAKEMHVGHLRSTIIGDSISRFLEFEGHEVLRVNHVGDWGTQFGMLIQYIRESNPEALEDASKFAISDLEEFYRASKKRFDENPEFADASRRAVVALQSGDPATLAVWKVFCDESLKHCHAIYRDLDIRIEDRGESFYNDDLAKVVTELKEKGLAVQAEGAWGVFLPGRKNEKDEPLATIVQKSDGGYIYATTDLAAVRHRFGTLKADRVIIITDNRQADHFSQVFEIADTAGWADKSKSTHIGFGMMLGADGKPFKTRTGGTVKLKDLLIEAEERALALAKQLSADFSDEDHKLIAKVAGIGGVKYSDLSHGIATDYKFDFDKMLATDGNTAIYVLMTYARTRGLARKAGLEIDALIGKVTIRPETEQEWRLLKTIAATPAVWQRVVEDLAPNALLAHLYELARDFGAFWNACPTLKLEDQELKNSRLALAAAVARVIKWGLSMVGIPVLEKV